MLLLLLICWTNLLSGNHMNNYYQAMSLLLMSPVTETVSFMHASPNSRIVQLLPLKKQVLIRGIIFWITSFFMVPIFIHFATLPTAPWCPFYSLRFAHSCSSLRVIFSVKSSSLEVFEQLSFFDVSMSKFNLGPMPLWHGAASPFYMPPPSSSY